MARAQSVLHVDDTDEGWGFVRAVLPALVGLQILLLVGTVGYVLVEGWDVVDALYMSVITLTTIGFGEVKPLSQAGRLFTIFYIVSALGLTTRFVTDVARYVVEGRLARDFRARRAKRELHHVHGHVIVVGYGRLGREIVADLLHHEAEVIVIDLEEPVSVPPGVRVVVGDATHDETLIEAGIERAVGMAVATPSDPVNVYITLSARQLSPDLFIHTRVEEEAAATKARRAGARNVLLPYQLGGMRMAQALLRPGSSAFIEHATHRNFSDLHLEDVFLAEGTKLEGTLRDLGLRVRWGVIVVAIQRAAEEGLAYPEADTHVGPGDTLVVVGPPEAVRAFVEDAGA